LSHIPIGLAVAVLIGPNSTSYTAHSGSDDGSGENASASYGSNAGASYGA
jgi:hypothetical protein